MMLLSRGWVPYLWAGAFLMDTTGLTQDRIEFIRVIMAANLGIPEGQLLSQV